MQVEFGVESLLTTAQILGDKSHSKDGKDGKEGKDDCNLANITFDFALDSIQKGYEKTAEYLDVDRCCA